MTNYNLLEGQSEYMDVTQNITQHIQSFFFLDRLFGKF